jgi:hypothetical protein
MDIFMGDPFWIGRRLKKLDRPQLYFKIIFLLTFFYKSCLNAMINTLF